MKKAVRILSCAAIASVMTLSSGMALAVSADWHSSSSGYYYTNDDGEKLTGWHTIAGKKYYFDKNGIAASGFKTISKKKYYFIKSKKGVMATGWQKIGADKYYFGTDGVMRTGWKTIGGKKYYFGTDGKMATGSVKISGKSYTFGSDGVLKEGTSSTGVSNVSLGMSQKRVISAAKLKNYTAVDIGAGMSGLLVYKQNFYGISDSMMVYVFNSDDKLIGIIAASEKSSGASTWKASLKKNYTYSVDFKDLINEAVEEMASYGYKITPEEVLEMLGYGPELLDMGTAIYYNDPNMQTGELGLVFNYQGFTAAVITDAENYMTFFNGIQTMSDVIAEQFGSLA